MRQINKAAVLGSGVMGSTIAAHLANAGIEVLVLDIVPKELTDEEKTKGLTLNDPEVRNRIANNNIAGLKKMKPAPFYLPENIKLIETGNFEDDIHKITEADWIIEVVVENMKIKHDVLKNKIIPNYKDGAILSTNTSGLSVNDMAEVLPEDIRKNFLVTHFFNPPRYMRLLELVPCKYTDKSVVDFMEKFISKRLGKGIVFAKDTPNFVGNRIGVYLIFSAIKHLQEMNLTVEEADAAAGQAIGLPKTAVFRLADLVGVDTIGHIGKNSYELLKDDEEREIYRLPDFLEGMIEKGLHGNKTKKGFYKKEKVEGKSVIYYYDYNSGEYKEPAKPKFNSVQTVKQLDDPKERVKRMVAFDDKGAEFAWRVLRDGLLYAFKRIPEIADDIVNVDNAMRWGFNWELGPFEIMDAIGVKKFVKKAKNDGVEVPDGLEQIESFYKLENGVKYYYDLTSGEYKEVPVKYDKIDFEILKSKNRIVESNAGASILDIGDGVFCLEFHSKMNAISGDIMNMTPKAIARAENEGMGLVIGNQGKAFSAGANLMLLAVAAAEGAFDDINMMVKQFQKATMSIKYSKVPVVAAPFNLALGGGCEYSLHSDARVAHAETYMGLVEAGVGLLPAGGGTKELAIKAIDKAAKFETDVSPFIFKYFKQIGMAQHSMGAWELFNMDYMGEGDAVCMDIDRLIYDAKTKVLDLARNYVPGKPRTGLKAPGRSVAASIKVQLWNMMQGGFITEYEKYIGEMIADVITGGDVNAGTLITEDYLLDLEREKFLKLCGQKKTLERIQHMLKKGKPLRN
ncbi:3-hydroxyacyl-CoA dehydrogenase/enoyl-CoA hydratase family protein [Flexistipes sinusarabici]|nr:3-hydroxyacyl-CoA dehydrogenase/enoyl-CoA hydratase family protein [Flexistipes sinusarabici]